MMDLRNNYKHIRGCKYRPHHKLGVSFGQSISDKSNGLQMINNCMQEFGLEKEHQQNYNIEQEGNEIITESILIRLVCESELYLLVCLRGEVWVGQQNINITT